MYLNHFCIFLKLKRRLLLTFLYISLLGIYNVCASTLPVSSSVQSPTAVENPHEKTKLRKYQVAKAGPEQKINPFLDALVSAYMTNSQLRSKVEEQKARNEQVARSLGAFRPNVGINANTGVSRTENQTARPNMSPDAAGRVRGRHTLHPSSAGLSITQSLYNGGTDVASVKSAENAAIAGQYDYLNTEQTILLNAITAYMEVILREKVVEFNKSNEKFLKEQLQALQLAVQVGDKTLTDQALAENRLAEATAGLYDAQADFQKAVANYETVIGMKPGLLVQPKSLQGLPASRDALVAMAKNTNPTILNALYAEKSAKHDLDAASGALLPKIDAQGTAERNLHSSTSRDRSNRASAFLTLKIPLYQGGGEYASIRQKAFIAAQSRFNLEQARKKVIEEAIGAWETWVAAKKKVERVLIQIKAAQRSRDGAVLEAEVGERSYVEALDAQRDLLKAQLALLQATRDEHIAQYQLLAVTGRLTAKELKLPVETYDIKEHLEEAKDTYVGT
jgi:outer membrane protein